MSSSEHLCFTSTTPDVIELEHFAPVPRTGDAFDVACRNIAYLHSDVDPLQFFIEDIVCHFLLEGIMSHAVSLNQLLWRTACGCLLHVPKVDAKAMNFDLDGCEFITNVTQATDGDPSQPRVLRPERWQVQRQSLQPIPDAVWDLYRHALQLAGNKSDARFVDRLQNLTDRPGYRDKIGRVRSLDRYLATPIRDVNLDSLGQTSIPL